jgi:hypothetical protein
VDALYCAFCLVVRKNDLKRAVTICNGQACCFDHLYYVQGGEYNKILEIIKQDTPKSEHGVIFVQNEKALKKELKEDASFLRGVQRRLNKLNE